jgi:hypothetical protein
VPDGAVWAALPLMGAMGVWSLRSLIVQVAWPKGDRGETGRDGPAMTVRDYREISDVLRKELNGRYMMADEARERFTTLEQKLDRHAEEVRAGFARCDFANCHTRVDARDAGD